jgi:hypothetical protein
MGPTRTLPEPLAKACAGSHPLELWILVNGEIVQCSGLFLPADERGGCRSRPRCPTASWA